MKRGEKSLGQVGYEAVPAFVKAHGAWDKTLDRIRNESELFAAAVEREATRRQKKKKP